MHSVMLAISWLLVLVVGATCIIAVLMTLDGSALGSVLFFVAAVLMHIVEVIDAEYAGGDTSDLSA